MSWLIAPSGVCRRLQGDGETTTTHNNQLRPWVQDYMRHTAISMYLAKHQHEGEAATWAGNSPNMIHQHYKGLVKESEAEDFWKLTPSSVESTIGKLPEGEAA